MILKKSEINGTEEIGLVTPTPGNPQTQWNIHTVPFALGHESCPHDLLIDPWGCSYNLNSFRPGQNGRLFADDSDSFKCIFINENFVFRFKFHWKFVPEGKINNIPALV